MAKKKSPPAASANGKARVRQSRSWTDEDLIRAWQKSDSAADAAGKLKDTPQQVCARAYQLRKRWVKLKKFARGTGADVEKLNELVESLE